MSEQTIDIGSEENCGEIGGVERTGHIVDVDTINIRTIDTLTFLLQNMNSGLME